jgi:hypothetical protein
LAVGLITQEYYQMKRRKGEDWEDRIQSRVHSVESPQSDWSNKVYTQRIRSSKLSITARTISRVICTARLIPRVT